MAGKAGSGLEDACATVSFEPNEMPTEMDDPFDFEM